MTSIKLSVDQTEGMAYITLSAKPVARTVEYSPELLVDLDAMNVAVGFELLDLDAVIPFEELTAKYHVQSSHVEIFKRIRPSINGWMVKTQERPVAARHEAHTDELAGV